MWSHKFILILCVLGSFWNCIDAYKILVVCTLPSMSHFILCKGAVDTLVDKGHDVSFISQFATKKPKFRDLTVPGIMYIKDQHIAGFNVSSMSALQKLKGLIGLPYQFTEPLFEDPDIQNFLSNKSEKFDVVIFEYGLNEMILGFGIKYNCPIIVLSSISPISWLATMTGNPLSLTTVPNVITQSSKQMNLKQRVINVGATLLLDIIGWLFMDPIQSSLYQKYFPEESKNVPFNELKKSTSLLLVNTHPSIGVVRPLLPNSVEIGGYHIKDPEPLPEDLQDILDNALNGVIYFSMGSSLKSSQMNPELKSILLNVFSSMKQTILWKYEEPLENIPKNLHIRQWMPQNDILAHPNVKLFISHGGLLSYTEAVHFGVPMIIIPIFGDQSHNAEVIEEKGNGFILEFENITEVSLKWALDEAIGNPKYKKVAKEAQQLYHDRPMKPRDLLAFHVEHVIRTGGAKHLSPPPLTLCSRLLIDVMAVLLTPVLCFMTIISCVLFKCCNKKNVKNEKNIKNEKNVKNKKKKTL